jgi:hypothetical protein
MQFHLTQLHRSNVPRGDGVGLRQPIATAGYRSAMQDRDRGDPTMPGTIGAKVGHERLHLHRGGAVADPDEVA